MLKVGYDNGNEIDIYVEHFGYDIMELAELERNEEQNHNSIESSDDEYYGSDDCEEIENVDFQTEGESVVIKNISTHDPLLNKLCSVRIMFRGIVEHHETETPLVHPDENQIDYVNKVQSGVLYPAFDPDIPWDKMEPTLGMRYETPHQLKLALANYGVAHGYQLWYMKNNWRKVLVYYGRNIEDGRCAGVKKKVVRKKVVKKKVVKKKVVKKKPISDSREGTSQLPKWTKKQVRESKQDVCPFRMYASWMSNEHCESSGSHTSRVGRTMTCTNCWQKGHNRATWAGVEVEVELEMKLLWDQLCEFLLAGSDNESDDASVHSEATIAQQQQNIQPQIITTVSNNNAKFPYLKKDEYEVWARRWNTGSQTKERIFGVRGNQRQNTLLQSIPDDHVADFHYMDDARDIWNAVKARFGGNVESKKMRKSMLKQEFSEFRISEAEGLHKGYDRMQKILSQLNQLKAKPEDEDINLNQNNNWFYEDFEHIEKMDLEEMDLKWQCYAFCIVYKFEQKLEGRLILDKEEIC
ncbi:hypothetical protein Tco_0128927 [Tanacetum coccineum]